MNVNQIQKCYTRVVKIGTKWNTYLQVDHQNFCIVEQAGHRRALWYRKMLVQALERLENKFLLGR